MQAAQDYASQKAHLEEKVANLRRQRDAAQKEIESLGLRVAIRELEKQARSLEGELYTMNERKSLLEQKLASLDAPSAQTAQQLQRPLVKPATPQ